ncbi:MAG: pseudouridine synthase [Patescibacteria group bacterium]|jgi:pseudouridine synthase|nr:pseudouridine synthase [Patescibacteria group bacterium]
MKIVLQKYIADSGHCSRRQAEELIRSGKVSVNKKKAELGMRVGERDDVFIGNEKIGEKKEHIYIILNKPVGYVCTTKKFKGEKNVFDLVKTNERLFIVGRLDKDSQGLVLLTNDGDLAQEMTHPSFEHEKKYIIEVDKARKDIQEIVKNFLKGVDIGRDPSTSSGRGDGIVWTKNAKHLGGKLFEIILVEGKKRQIRRMFATQGLEVKRLTRISLGKLKLSKLENGKWKNINKNQII